MFRWWDQLTTHICHQHNFYYCYQAKSRLSNYKSSHMAQNENAANTYSLPSYKWYTESFILLIDHISGWFNGQNHWIVSRNLTQFSLTMLVWFCYVYGYRSQIIKIKLLKNIWGRGPALSVVCFAWETRNRKWFRSFPVTVLLSCSFEVQKKHINSSKNILHYKRNQKPLKQVY